MKTKNFFLLACLMLANFSYVFAQYHYSNTNGTTIASSQSGVATVNCDVRSYSSTPVTAIVWDGTAPSFYWAWNGHSNTISLPSTAVSPDIAVVYNIDLDNVPYILVVYSEYTSTTVTNIAFRVYKFNSGTNQFAIQSGDSHDYSCSSSNNTKVNIDAESRGFFVFTWESALDLHTVAGKLTASGSHINIGVELTLTLPSGCSNDIITPDVAIFSKNGLSPNAYVYYTYVRCFSGNHPVIGEQTYSYYDVLTMNIPPSILSSFESNTTLSPDYNIWGYPRIAANQYFQTGQSDSAKANEFTIVCDLFHYLNMTASQMNTIYAMTSIYDGSTTITYSQYNLNTSDYLSLDPQQEKFFNLSSSIAYTPVDNSHCVTTNVPNLYPAVTYDKNNDNIVIVWDMVYGEGTYAANFPDCPFPAQMLANPVYDETASGPVINSSNNPVVNPGSGSLLEYRSLDNTQLTGTGNTDFIVATNSHNTQDIVYAWHMGGSIYWKVISSGTTPRLSGSEYGNEDELSCFPNPINIANSPTINLNLVAGQRYSFRIFNDAGQMMDYFTGDKNEIEHATLEILKKSGTGIYNLQVVDENNLYSNCRVVTVK